MTGDIYNADLIPDDLKGYFVRAELGLEATPAEYVERLVAVFREVRRALTDDATLWLNLGDSFSDKQLVGIPWRVAFALQDDGWFLRSDIIWHKPNAMPESVRDRPTAAHEHLFLLAKCERYYYDSAAIQEPSSGDPRGPGLHNAYSPAGQQPHSGSAHATAKHRTSDKQRGHSKRHAGFNDRRDLLSEAERTAMGRNKRSVWTVATHGFSEAHFATFPPDLIRPCILAGSEPGDTILDPFNGAGTTGLVALQHGREYVGIDINDAYLDITRRRLAPLLAQPRLLEAIA